MTILLIVLTILSVIVFLSMMEQKRLKLQEYTIASNKIPGAFDGTKIVVLADLHNKTFGKTNARLIHKINELHPEVILVAGDMIVKKQPLIPSVAYTLLKELSQSYPIYYALGNHEESNVQSHETHHWENYKKSLEKLGVVFLENQSYLWKKKSSAIRITGISIGLEFFQRRKNTAMDEHYLTSLVKNETSKDYHILMAHNPVYFKQYQLWGADLTIAGHIHGGLVRLPFLGGILSPQGKFFPKYDGGLYTEEQDKMIVSRGLGSHSIMIRLFNPPELVTITLKKV